jgi:hypothetical protein
MYCVAGMQHCCETPEGNATPTSCIPTAMTCPSTTGYTDWQCEDPVADCPAATPVCCGTGTLVMGTPGCGNYASEMHGTSCVATGACSTIILCTSDAECVTFGKTTCVPFEKAGNDVGGCQ